MKTLQTVVLVLFVLGCNPNSENQLALAHQKAQDSLSRMVVQGEVVKEILGLLVEELGKPVTFPCFNWGEHPPKGKFAGTYDFLTQHPLSNRLALVAKEFKDGCKAEFIFEKGWKWNTYKHDDIQKEIVE